MARKLIGQPGEIAEVAVGPIDILSLVRRPSSRRWTELIERRRCRRPSVFSLTNARHADGSTTCCGRTVGLSASVSATWPPSRRRSVCRGDQYPTLTTDCHARFRLQSPKLAVLVDCREHDCFGVGARGGGYLDDLCHLSNVTGSPDRTGPTTRGPGPSWPGCATPTITVSRSGSPPTPPGDGTTATTPAGNSRNACAAMPTRCGSSRPVGCARHEQRVRERHPWLQSGLRKSAAAGEP